jgi:Tol biopolymer transport system component
MPNGEPWAQSKKKIEMISHKYKLITTPVLALFLTTALCACSGGGSDSGGGMGPNVFVTAKAVFAWAPTGQQLAFTMVPPNGDSTLELVTINADGTGRTMISNDLRQGGLFYSAFAWSPAATRIAYLLEDTGNGVELATSRSDGSGAIRLAGRLVSDGSGIEGIFSTVAWSPDGSSLAYVAEATPGSPELFVATADGATSLQISGPQVAGGFVGSGLWSPDGTRLAYLASQDTAGLTELYVGSADGAGNIKVSVPVQDGDSIMAPVWSPDGANIAYLLTRNNSSASQLYIADVDANSNTAIFPVAISSGIDIDSMRWSPDGSRFAYVADLDQADALEAYTVLPDGTGHSKISGNLVVGGSITDLGWAPDGSRLLYRADQNIDEEFELYSVLPDGSDLRPVSGSLVSGGTVLRGDLISAWSPDASRVTYAADQDVLDEIEAFVSSPDGSTNTRISNLNATGGGALQPIWSPSGAMLAYVAAEGGEFYATTVGPDGSDAFRISGTETGGNLLTDLAWSADANRLAYRVRSGDEVNFYTVRPDGSSRVRITANGMN